MTAWHVMVAACAVALVVVCLGPLVFFLSWCRASLCRDGHWISWEHCCLFLKLKLKTMSTTEFESNLHQETVFKGVLGK